MTNNIAGLTMPDTSTSISNSGAYQVSVQSRGSGGTFAALVSSPSARVTIPLANVRNFNTNYSPVLSNSIVAVEGTANVSKLANQGGANKSHPKRTFICARFDFDQNV